MLANQAELGINLASLKRHDPYISEIIDCSTHVALYRYVINDQVWVCVNLKIIDIILQL